MRYDAIVIGGGHNGLICATYLARSGLRTLVVEARDTIGGCASTVDALGVRVNICNCDHLMVRSTPIIEELGLTAHGLEYLDLDPSFVAMSWGGSPAWSHHFDSEETVERLSHTHPGSAGRYHRYLEVALPAARLVSSIAGDIPRPATLVRTMAASGRTAAQTVMRWSKLSALDVLSEFFVDEALITPALTTGPVVWGLSPSTPGTGLAALAYAMRHVLQVGRPRGGSGGLITAISRAFEGAGGTIETGQGVSRITRTSSKVTGVIVDDERIEADIVIAAIDPTTVATLLGEQAETSSDEPDGYESKIDAVLDALPRFANLAAPLSDDILTSTAVISPSVADIHVAAGLRSKGMVAPWPMMLANTPSVADQPLAGKSGGHVFSLEVLWTPYALDGGWLGSSEPARWLDQFGTLIEGDFRSSVRDWRAMTPPDYERDFGMRRGYAPSFPGSPIDALIGRPKPLARYRTEHSGLYLTGAATYPGAGIWGASGRNAAHQIIRDRKIHDSPFGRHMAKVRANRRGWG